jgi:hypothetical protein
VKNVAQRISSVQSTRRSSNGLPKVIYVSVIIVGALTKDNILTQNKLMCVLHASTRLLRAQKDFGSIIKRASKRSSRFQFTPDSMIKLSTTL